MGIGLGALALKAAPALLNMFTKNDQGENAVEGAAGKLAAGPTSMGIGLAQLVSGKRQQKKADAMMPAMENPEERAMLNYVRRRKRAYQTGTASHTQGKQLAAMMKTGMEKSMASAGGAKGLNQMSKMYQQAMLGMNQQNLQGEQSYAAMEQKGVEKLADRRLQLGLLKYNTQQARAAEKIRGGRSNMMSGLASMMGSEEDVTAVGGEGNYETDGGAATQNKTQ
jgi:hypothetical protein